MSRRRPGSCFTRNRQRTPTARDTLGDLLTKPMVWPAGVDAVVCLTADAPSPFRDDVLVPCAGCGVTVRHHPYIPAHVEKLCPDCALRRQGGTAA